MRFALTFAAALGAAASVSAQEPFLSQPLDCTLGSDCYIEDYVDRDASSGFQDFACGWKTRDGHNGTDFALTSRAAFDRGVAVLSAAPGVVEAVRDGMPDLPYTAETASSVDGRECGNAVRLRHENGLQTLYCHLRSGSVAVAPGDSVERGAVLGLVGMSGQSNYPHVHFSVLGPSGNMDPFRLEAGASCTTDAATLWLSPPQYTQTGMFTAGFSDRIPKFEDVRSGAARKPQGLSAAPLVLYTHFYHAQPGDVIDFLATGPDGEVFAKQQPLEAPKKNQFLAYGRKAPKGGWTPGEYLGRATLLRDGQVIAVRFTQSTLR